MPRAKKTTTPKLSKKAPSKPSTPSKASSAAPVSPEAELKSVYQSLQLKSEKQIDVLKKESTQLDKKFKKAEDARKKAKEKRVSLVKKVAKKSTPAHLKQLDAAKEKYQVAQTASDELKEAYKTNRLALKEAKESNIKFKALLKTVSQFEKSWTEKTKKSKKNVASKKKTSEAAA